MQVAHQNDHITHVVVGGAETIEFGISSSAEFFNILSSTLYKDQILAVVRETLCNAWDAHIEAGVTHLPVQITLTEDKFIIRDFGTGIHRDDMGTIYGTYGNSTKKNDGKQTGGFGLGCKAPFAYTDHFEVISSHDGVRTIYNLSKSSAQAMGKPGIVPIASFPTKETGLQVSIHIANRSDQQKFMNLVKRIVRNGDMNMTLNEQVIERLGFDSMQSNYFITAQEHIIDNAPKIMIRYGNVVYPVDNVDSIRPEYQRINAHLNRMQGLNATYRILFQAPPHSISVTPSRESLSMQEHTIKSLTSLFCGFLDMLNNPVNGFQRRCYDFAEETVKLAVQQARIPELLSSEAKLPIASLDIMERAPNQLYDLTTMARRYMEVNYPNTLAFRRKDIGWRLQGMADAKLLDRGLVQTYLRAMDKLTATHYGNRSDWLQRQVIAPLVVRLVKAGLSADKLYGFDRSDLNVPINYSRKGIAPLVKAVSISPESLFHALPYLRNIIVISSSCQEIKKRAAQREEFRKMGTQNAFLFYHIGLKKKERENALEFFKQSGMLVIDLTVKTAREVRETEYKTANLSPRKPTLKGTVSMLSILKDKGTHLNTELSRKDGAKRIDNPEFVVQVSMRNEVSKSCFDRWGNEASQSIVALFGDKGGITFNSAAHDKWIKQGVKEMRDYVIAKVSAEIANNPRIHEYFTFDPDSAIAESDHLYGFRENPLVHVVYNTPVLQKEFGLVNNLTKQDKNYLCLWKKIINTRSMTDTDVVSKVMAQVNAIKLDPANAIFLARFKDNPLVSLIHESKFIYLMEAFHTKPEHIASAINLLVAVLKK